MDKKTAVIIGADERLGSLLSDTLKKRGVAAVTVAQKNRPAPQGEGYSYATSEELFELCRQISQQHGPADYLICNVLGDPAECSGALHETDTQSWQDAKKCSMDMIYDAARTFIAPMAQRGSGRVLFIGSIGGVMSAAGQDVRSSMSAAVYMLMQSIAVESGEYGLSVNALALGPMEGCWGGMPANDRLIAHIPMGCVGHADEAVNVAVYTLLDAPDYLSGNTIRLDGALSCAFMRDW